MTKATGGDKRFDWSSAVSKPDGAHKPRLHLPRRQLRGRSRQVLRERQQQRPRRSADRCRSVRAAHDLEERLVHLQARVQERWWRARRRDERHSSRWPVLATWTLRTETDAIGGELGEVGGNRYALARQQRLRRRSRSTTSPGSRTRRRPTSATRRGCGVQPLASGQRARPGSPRGGPGLLVSCDGVSGATLSPRPRDVTVTVTVKRGFEMRILCSGSGPRRAAVNRLVVGSSPTAGATRLPLTSRRGT